MAGAVTAQCLGQPAKHQIAVGLQHHVDEVDHHHAADVAQPQLADDLLGRLNVVLGDRLFEIAARAGELAGVDVDDRHGLGAIDHQRAARGQPHLAVHRLGQLLVDAVDREHVRALRPTGGFVPGDLRNQFGGNSIDVCGDGLPGSFAGHHKPGEVLIEQIANHLDQDIGLLIERHGRSGRLGLGLLGLLGDLGPTLLQAVDVAADVVFLHALRGGADDHAGVGRNHLAQNLFETLALGIGQLATDAGGRRPRHVDQITPGQRDLGGQARAFVADRILADLDDDVVAGLERLFDLAGGSAQTGSLPVDLTGVEDAVAAAADVDEGRLHRGQHVLHDAEVDVAHQRCRGGRCHEVLNDDAVLEHRDLGVAGALMRRFGANLVANDHHPVDGLAAGQELRLGQDRRAAPSRVAAVPAALPLGLQPGRAADALDLAGVAFGLLPRRALVDHGIRRVVGGSGLSVVTGPALAASAPTTPAGDALALGTVLIGGVLVGLGVGTVGDGVVAGGLLGLVILGLLTAATAATATASAAAPIGGPVGGLTRLVGDVVVLVVLGVVRLDVVGGGRSDRLRCYEEGHVGVGFDDHHRALVGGLLRRDDHHLGTGCVVGRQQLTNPHRVGLIDAGLGAA